jgi:parallel beta-helix repeat protein
LKRKVLTIIIILLFIETSIIPLATSNQTLGKNIITVDDEPGDADYTTITEALNHSNPGDTIEVYSGTYNERLINMTTEEITLQGIDHELGNGTDTGKPFIDGGGLFVVISVFAPNVTITGFHMENQGETATILINIEKSAFNCTISDNTLSNSTLACIQCEASNCVILNNSISHSNIRQGILIYKPSSQTIISENHITDCELGIDLWTSGGNHRVERNEISHCREYGLNIIGTEDNTIIQNSFEDNPLGLYIDSSSGNRIEKNNFLNNTRDAFFVFGLELPRHNTWKQNYWSQPRLLPYPIHGNILFFFHWIQFDWRPAQQPYDIPGIT